MPLSPIRVCSLLALAAPSLGGCGDTFVDPFLRDASALSVYGVLESGFANEPPTEQTIRVQSVRTNAEPPTDPDDPSLDYRITVTSFDTFSGDSTRWQQRRTQFSDGTYGDLFSATFRPRPGGSYRIVVRRDDGRVAVAGVAIPDDEEGTVLDWELREPRRQVIERVAWETLGLDNASAVVEMSCGLGCGSAIRFEDLPVAQLDDGRFVAEYPLQEARRRGCIENTPPPTEANPTPGCPPLTLDRVRVRARLLGPEWARADDPTQTTVENGYGFVGGASLAEKIYRPSASAAEAAGLRY